jgi:hypothetical protein
VVETAGCPRCCLSSFYQLHVCACDRRPAAGPGSSVLTYLAGQPSQRRDGCTGFRTAHTVRFRGDEFCSMQLPRRTTLHAFYAAGPRARIIGIRSRHE